MQILFSFFILIFYLSLHAQAEFYQPLGTIALNDSVYIDKLLITNDGWKEFLFYNKKNDVDLMPDTSYFVGNKNYFKNPKFKNSPVIGVSESAKIEYCKWRSDFVTNNLKNYSDSSTCKSPFYVNNFKKNIEVIYSLASQNDIDLAKKKNLLLENKINKKIKTALDVESKSFRCVARIIYL